MAPNEYRITCEAQPGPSSSWLIRVWIREVGPERPPGPWQCYLTYGYTATFADDVRRYAAFKNLLKAMRV